MKKGFLLIFLILTVFCLSSCGEKTPSERDLKNLIPNDVLVYTFDGVSYTSSLAKLEIERQQTNEKECVADCLITLEDDRLIRTAHITMYLEFWDKGGWQLDWWEANASEEFTFCEEFDTNRFWAEIDNFGFKRDGIIESSVATQGTPHHIAAVYSVAQEYANLDVFGDIIAEARLYHSDSYPQSYAWSITLDTSERLSFEWDITGDWYVNMTYNNSPSIKSNISITDMSERLMYTDINKPFFRISGEATTYYKLYNKDEIEKTVFDDWDHALEKGTNLNDMHLLFDVYYIPEEPIRIRFYPDCAYSNKASGGDVFNPGILEDDEAFLVTKENN